MTPEEALITPAMFVVLASMLMVSLALVLYRIVKGPNILDRVLCLDVVALIVICMMAVWKVGFGTGVFFDALLVLTISGFISTVAFAKYLEDGNIVD